MSLDIGSIGPDFALPDQEGNYTKLARLLDGATHLVVYFFPQADSPGCTREACGFRDVMPELTARGVRVVGISADPPSAQAAFAAKNNLNFPVLSDADHRTSEEWGAWRGMGVGRMTFILDDKGVVEKVFPRVDVNRHAADVLALYADAAPAPQAPAAAPVQVDQAELIASLARSSLQLLLAHVDGGGALPADVADLAARVAARR